MEKSLNFPHVEILDGGLKSTLQDAGRWQYLGQGVPLSGAMDYQSMVKANLLVGNDFCASVLEMQMIGCKLRFTGNSLIAISGADMSPSLDGALINTYESIPVFRDSILHFKVAKQGFRTYLAIQGDWDVESVMGSKSTYTYAGFGGWEGRSLKPGDKIPIGPKQEYFYRKLDVPFFPSQASIRVVPGPEYELFRKEARELFCSHAYTIRSESNRMGYRLQGPQLEIEKGVDMISSAVLPGTVQVLPSGQSIIAMRDAQTSGGYPRIANVIRVDWDVLAQLGPGAKVRFRWCKVEDAQELWRRRIQKLENLF